MNLYGLKRLNSLKNGLFVLKVEKFNSKFILIYFSWDEWVPEDRILKCSDINMQKLSDQEQEERAAPNKKTKKGKEAVKIQTSRRSEGSKEKEKESNSRASTPISFPEKVPSRVSKSWGNLNPTAMILDSPSDNTTPRRKRGYYEKILLMAESHFSKNLSIFQST